MKLKPMGSKAMRLRERALVEHMRTLAPAEVTLEDAARALPWNRLEVLGVLQFAAQRGVIDHVSVGRWRLR